MGLDLNDDALRDACRSWQDGRDGGSSPLRAAARVLTNTPHYFTSDFITRYEREAAADPTTMSRATTLLEALAHTPALSPVGWGERTGFTSDWAGRGIKSGDQDAQIQASIESGTLAMPLWGLSLDREVALTFGTRFLFEMVGPFPAIPASEFSGIKPDERELIAGGRYSVEHVSEESDTTIVHLRFIELVSAA